jgi:hypothetical protein
MQFVYPSVLWFGALAALPLIIHLFNLRRYKPLYFPSLAFLKEIQQETKSVKKIREYLILAFRMLALLMLVVAFAGPYLPAAKQPGATGEKYISIFVDNSPSMNTGGKQGTLLDEALGHARTIAQGFSPSDHFQLLTNDFEGRHQRFVSREDFLEMLKEVKPGVASRALPQITEKQQALFQEARGRKFAYLLSDFQTSRYKTETLPRDTQAVYTLVKMQSNTENNACIDTLYWEKPPVSNSNSQELHAQLQCSGEGYTSVPSRLYVNNKPRAVADLHPEGSKPLPHIFSFSGDNRSYQLGKLQVQDAPVTFDDVFYFSYKNPGKIHVLLISKGSPSPYLHKLLSDDPYLELREADAGMLNYREFSAYDCIILSGLADIPSGLSFALSKQVQSGKTCVLVPPANADPSSWNAFSSSLGAPLFGAWDTSRQQATAVAFAHPLLLDVFEKPSQKENTDFPVCKGTYQSVMPTGASGIALLELPGKHALVNLTEAGRGKLCEVFQPLDSRYGNLQEHALFVASLYKLILSSMPRQPLYYVLSGENKIVLPGIEFSGDKKIRLVQVGGGKEYLPTVQSSDGNTLLTLYQQPAEPGNYFVMDDRDTLEAVSFNYRSEESQMACLSLADLESDIEQQGYKNVSVVEGSDKILRDFIRSESLGRPLHRLFLALAFAFLLAEMCTIVYFNYFYRQAARANAPHPSSKG